MSKEFNYNLSPSNHKVFRLDDLRLYQLLGSAPEASFDDLTGLAAHICGAPIALISFLDANHQWLKSQVGFSEGTAHRYLDFCEQPLRQHKSYQEGEVAIATSHNHIVIVADASTDKRFATHKNSSASGKLRVFRPER